MARTFKVPTGTVLSTSLQTLLTFSASLITGGAVLQALQLTNVGSTARVVLVYFIPSGQVAANGYLIGKVTVPANDTVALPGGPFWRSSSSFIQAIQDAGADVTAFVTAFEESA